MHFPSLLPLLCVYCTSYILLLSIPLRVRLLTLPTHDCVMSFHRLYLYCALSSVLIPYLISPHHQYTFTTHYRSHHHYTLCFYIMAHLVFSLGGLGSSFSR